MGTMRPGLTEFECCPQCAGRMSEALDAAGISCDSRDMGGCGCCDEGCQCQEECACVQPDSGSKTPSG